MTDKEKYEALVAEIEHQKEETSIGLNEWENGEEHGRMDVINALQEKIKSMQGKPANDDLEKEVYEHLWKGRMGADVSKPIYFSYDELLEVASHFTNWQKQQLMKDAVDGWIEEPECLLWRVISVNLESDFVLKNKLQDGEPVKVIIIKED